MKFKGFDEWIEIFRGGEQVDRTGKKHDGDKIIDNAIATFDPEVHEPPIVVGHPKDNAPAFAWVEDLKEMVKGGVKVLLAKFKQVVPEFEEMVKKGLFKKRSASFYPDGRLRHVGFLGAAPPAVKGLADLKFEDQEKDITFDFYDEGLNTIARIFRGLRDWLIEKEGKEKADAIIPDWDVEYIREKANQEPDQIPGEVQAYRDQDDNDKKKEDKPMGTFKEKLKNYLGFMGVDMSKVPDDALPDAAPSGTAPNAFSEADIEAVKKEAAEAERKRVVAEFEEKAKEKRQAERKKEIAEFCEKGVEAGTLAPAWVKYGLPQILSFLASNDDVIEFGEAKEKANYYERLKGLFETEIPRLVDFKEIASRDKDVDAGEAGEKIAAIVRKKMADNKDLDFNTAFAEAQTENPGLAAEYAEEIKPEK